VNRRSTPYYAPGEENPRHDVTFVEGVAEQLLQHRGEFVHMEAVVGGDPWVIHEAVQCLRRVGWHIDSQDGKRPGYRFIGWQRPKRWLHLDSVYREYLLPQMRLF
jgi:hypothetical protein